jgi:ferredoxin
MKAIVDKETYTRCTLCTQTCPEVFRMQEDKAVAYVDAVLKEIGENCKKAADECPVNAISV